MNKLNESQEIIEDDVTDTVKFAQTLHEELKNKFNPETDALIAPAYLNELLGIILTDEQWIKTIFMPNVHRISIIREGFGRKIPEEIEVVV